MKIQIHARKAELAEDFRDVAEEKLNSIGALWCGH